MLIVNDHVPHSLRGIVLAGFLAAFMSTIATQLNWGTSYIVEDFYRRFVTRRASERHYVHASQIVTLMLVVVAGWVAVQLTSIRSGWEVVLQLGAGTGGVYLLRWYWWRINAWSEISAMATSIIVTLALNVEQVSSRLFGRPEVFSGSGTVVFAKTILTTTAASTLVWIAVTLLTKPESSEVLLAFYRKVRPQITGWRPIAARAPEIPETRDLSRNLKCWVLGTVMTYCALFGVGKLLFQHYLSGSLLVLLGAACAWKLSRELSRSTELSANVSETSAAT
jgi:Na+/proline symporter